MIVLTENDLKKNVLILIVTTSRFDSSYFSFDYKKFIPKTENDENQRNIEF